MADITCQRGAVKRHHVALANGNRVFHRRDIGGGQGRQGRDIGLGDAKRRQAVRDIALLAQIHQPIDHRLAGRFSESKYRANVAIFVSITGMLKAST